MKRSLFAILFCLGIMNVNAHQPDISSTMLVQKNDSTWVVQIRASLTALEYEVGNSFGKDAYATAEDFENLVIRHFRNHLQVYFNAGDPMKMEKGKVKLGHEASVSFEISVASPSTPLIQIRNTGFREINKSQSALIVYKEGFAKDQFLLNSANQYTVELMAKDSKFSLVTPKTYRSNFLPSYACPGLAFFTFGILVLFGKNVLR